MSLATPMCLYESVVYQDAPLRWWGLDEASPTADDSGNGGTLTAVGSPANNAPLLTFDAGGTADGARDFNGSTQSYTAAAIGAHSANGAWSVEFWMVPDVVTGSQTIFSSGTNALQIRRETTRLQTYTQGGAAFIGTTGLTLAAGTIYHVVIASSLDNFYFATSGGAINALDFQIAVNGVNYADANGVFNQGGTWTPRIGSLTGGSEWFDGKLDEFAIYNYGLSIDQILQHYNAGKNGTWGTQFLGVTGSSKYPFVAVEAAFGTTYQHQGTSQQFFDVTGITRSVSFSRGGTNAALDPPRAGTMSVDLNNTLGEFEDNPAARFYNESFALSAAAPGKAMRVRAWWPDTAQPVQSLYYGYVEAMAFRRRPGSSEPVVSFNCSDILQFLAQAEGDDNSQSAEGSDDRIDAILESLTYPYGGASKIPIPQDFENGNATVAFKVSSGNILSLINEVTFTEGGGSIFFQGKDGRLKFFNNTHRSAGLVKGIYGGYATGTESGNLVANHGFETNTSGWTAAGTNSITRTVSPDPVKYGVGVAYCTYGDSLAGVSVTPTLAAGTTYTMSAWIYLPGSWNGGAVGLDDNGTLSDVTAEAQVNASTSLLNQWQQVSYQFTTGADVTGTLHVRMLSAPSVGRLFYIDGVSLAPTIANLPYRGSDPVHDTSSVYTIVEWANAGIPITTTQTDSDYSLKFGDRVHTKATLHTTQGLIDAAALAFLNRFKNSSKRIPVIAPVPQSHSDVAGAWRVWLGHELGDKIIHVDTAEGGLGTVALTQYIEGIQMRLTPDSIECALNISPYS